VTGHSEAETGRSPLAPALPSHTCLLNYVARRGFGILLVPSLVFPLEYEPAPVWNHSRFQRLPVPPAATAFEGVLPTGPPNMAAYSLTWNASSPFQAEPTQAEKNRK